MAFRWRANGPLIVAFGSFLISSAEKNVVKVGPSLKVGPPLTKPSGPAHADRKRVYGRKGSAQEPKFYPNMF